MSLTSAFVALLASVVCIGNAAPSAEPTTASRSPFASQQGAVAKDSVVEDSVVEAEGFGATRQEAIDKALLASIMMEVGGILDSETLVQNDQVVRDTLRQRSAGIVKRYEIIKEEARDGGTLVRVRATAGRQALVAVTGKIKTGSAKVSGKSLLAKRKSMARAEDDIRSAALEPLGTLLTAPFTVALSEDGLMNAIGMKLPHSESGLVIPVVLTVDIERWNQQSKAIVDRLTALGQLVSSKEFAIRPWCLDAPESQTQVAAAGKSIEGADAEALHAFRASPEPAKVWIRRLVDEAAKPYLVTRDDQNDPQTVVGRFWMAGYLELPSKEGLAQVETYREAFRRNERVPCSILGVVHAVGETRATISYFKLNPGIIEAVRAAQPSRYAIKVSLVDAQGTEFKSEQIQLDRRRPLFLAEGQRDVGTGTNMKEERVLALVPGSIDLGSIPRDAWGQRHQGPDAAKQGGTEGIDHAWFGMLATKFSEQEIERAEEIRVRSLPTDAKSAASP